MSTPSQKLVHAVLALAKVGDLFMLSKLYRGRDRAAALEIGSLLQDFDYQNSIAFQELTDGKSEAVLHAWRRRVAGPVMRQELTDDLYARFRCILEDDGLERFFPEELREKIDSVRNALRELDRE